MATQQLLVGETPQNIATELGLTADVSYILQVIGTRPVRFAESPTTPTIAGHELKPQVAWTIQVSGTDHPWVWTTQADTFIAVTEAI